MRKRNNKQLIKLILTKGKEICNTLRHNKSLRKPLPKRPGGEAKRTLHKSP
jgi:hypothetical protein